MVDIVFDIDEEGNMHGLYSDEISLFSVGRIVNVRKASNVEFNEEEQVWEVLSLNGDVLHKDKNRQAAIDWEITSFSPGGKHHFERKNRSRKISKTM